MKTSPAGIELIKRFESCRLDAYPDPKTGGKPWTCGWGATGEDIGPDTHWTQEQADARLLEDIEARERMVLKAVTHQMSQGQFDAFVSIVFNVGHGSAWRDGIIELRSGFPSTLLRKFNSGDIGGCEAEWTRWVSPGSKVAHGLLNRRMAELELFRS